MNIIPGSANFGPEIRIGNVSVRSNRLHMILNDIRFLCENGLNKYSRYRLLPWCDKFDTGLYFHLVFCDVAIWINTKIFEL